jgi:hypothetical protein
MSVSFVLTRGQRSRRRYDPGETSQNRRIPADKNPGRADSAGFSRQNHRGKIGIVLRIFSQARWLPFALLIACPAHSLAQGKLEANYTASLAGIPTGKGSWVVDVGESQYSAAASGMTTGLVRIFIGGHGTGAAKGTLAGGRPVASNYSATIKSGRHTDEIRMTVAGGTVKDYKVEPPPEPNPKRVPVTEAQRHDVMDPMTASLVLVPGTGEMQGPQACDRTMAIFDGKLRYDLKFTYKRIENVAAEKGYSGPAVVCSVSFAPVGGYIPSRAAIKYLARTRDMEVWLVPIAGTRMMVPFRAQIATPFGQGVVEATRFVTVAGVPQAKFGKTR